MANLEFTFPKKDVFFEHKVKTLTFPKIYNVIEVLHEDSYILWPFLDLSIDN